MNSKELRDFKKNIRSGLIEYMEKKSPGKKVSTYKTYVSDSFYLLNNEQEDAYIRFMRADGDMLEVKELIKNLLIEKRGKSKVTDNGTYYYEKLCWQREYIKQLGGIDSLII